MAKKPVKKAAAPKKPVAKKTVAKKPVAKKVAPAAAPVAPVVAPTCAAGCGCGCKRGGFCRFVKKLIVFIIIFALGFTVAKMCPCGKRMHRGPQMPMPEFVNGCLDLSSVKCPEMAEKVTLADANADGCITSEEFKSFRKEMRKNCKSEDCPFKRGERPTGPRGDM